MGLLAYYYWLWLVSGSGMFDHRQVSRVMVSHLVVEWIALMMLVMAVVIFWAAVACDRADVAVVSHLLSDLPSAEDISWCKG